MGMKYELFFLNNIHDSVEMVNVELDPFLDLSSQGILRLKNVCEMECTFIANMHIYQYRNRLMHYTLNSTCEQIIKDVSDAMKEIAEFVEKEIIKDLPQEAQKNFQDTIVGYRKYAETLKELKL